MTVGHYIILTIVFFWFTGDFWFPPRFDQRGYEEWKKKNLDKEI